MTTEMYAPCPIRGLKALRHTIYGSLSILSGTPGHKPIGRLGAKVKPAPSGASATALVWLALAILLIATTRAWAAPGASPDDGSQVTKHCLDEPVFGGRACTYEANPSASDVVVLVHGINGSALEDWVHQIPVLAKKYHVLTFDLPGFGDSDKGNRAYTPANYARFVHFVTTRYARGRFVLVGHSMGAAIALYYAATYPQDLKGLVLIDAAGVLYPLSLTVYSAGAWLDDVRDVSPDEPNVLGRVVGKVLEKVERLPFDPQSAINTREGRNLFLNGSPTRIAALALAYEDFSALLDQVTVPVLVIWGSHDTVAPLRTGRVLAARLRDARLKVVDGADHMSMREHPEIVNRMLTDYLRQPSPPQPPPKWEEQPPDTERDGACHNRSGIVYTGRYRHLEIDSCRDIVVRDAWIDHITVRGSRVRIRDTSIVSAGTALYATGSEVTVTNSRIKGRTAVRASGSRLDIANGELVAARAAVEAGRKSNVVFSVSRIVSQYNHGAIHQFVTVTPDRPL